MQLKFVVPVLASLAFAGPVALAQDAPQGPMHHGMQMSAEDMSKHHADMCSNMYAGAVGRMAALEVKLNLTAAQKPLFERWKNAVLSSIKAHEGACTNAKMPDRDASVVDMAKRQLKMMETHLADLRAQMPALEALVGSLNAEQNKVLDRAAMHLMHDRAGMMGRMHDMMGHMRGHGGHDSDGDTPPPPPPEQ